jgi:hypothetical protein
MAKLGLNVFFPKKGAPLVRALVFVALPWFVGATIFE